MSNNNPNNQPQANQQAQAQAVANINASDSLNTLAVRTGIANAKVRNQTPVGSSFPFVVSSDIDALLTNMGDPELESLDTVIAVAMVLAVNEVEGLRPLIRSAKNGAWEIPVGKARGGHTVVDAALKVAGVAGLNECVLKQFLLRLEEAIVRAPTYITDLVMAQQAKPMSKDSIKSYFAQFKMMGVRGHEVYRVVQSLALLLPNVRDVANLDKSDSPWMKYRLNASSTPSLCQRVLDIWGDSVPGMISENTKASILAAVAEPWNLTKARVIPSKMITLTHATLTAFKCYPEGWYYGDSHKSSCNAMLYRGYYKAAQRLAELGAGTESMDAAKTLSELVTAIPATLKGA
jgi:hypothetical protein